MSLSWQLPICYFSLTSSDSFCTGQDKIMAHIHMLRVKANKNFEHLSQAYFLRLITATQLQFYPQNSIHEQLQWSFKTGFHTGTKQENCKMCPLFNLMAHRIYRMIKNAKHLKTAGKGSNPNNCHKNNHKSINIKCVPLV